MKIDTKDFLILAYDAFGGEMKGKTLLQKRINIISEILEYDCGYEAHYYGPYSYEVNSANSALKAMGFLDEESSKYGSDARGFEVARHDFKLTKDGKWLAKKLKKQYPKIWADIRSSAEKVNQAGDLNYMELSIAAKAYYILKKEGGESNPSRIKKIAETLDWDVSEDSISKAGDFLEKVDLIRRT